MEADATQLRVTGARTEAVLGAENGVEAGHVSNDSGGCGL